MSAAPNDWFSTAGPALAPGCAPVGLLAGGGRFPIAFAQKARSVGIPVVCLGVRGHADRELEAHVDQFHWCAPLRLSRMIRLYRRAGVRQIVMAGKIHKANLLYKPWKMVSLLPDWRTIKLWYFRPRSDNKDDTILLAIIGEFAREGLEFSSALNLCPELLVKPGPLTRRTPTASERTDIAFGWALARKMGELDVGQSVSVMDRSILAVEAVEGTDRAIERAGDLCKSGGFVVVKVAKPHQDMRFDVPTIGTATVETLYRAGGKVLAIEADKTIVLDQAETIALADRYRLTIVALSE